MALLEITNVDISYGKRVIVKDCSLTLDTGEICSIVGESGSGKTTVIRAVLGLIAGGVVLLGLIGFLLWHFVLDKDTESETETEVVEGTQNDGKDDEKATEKEKQTEKMTNHMRKT